MKIKKIIILLCLVSLNLVACQKDNFQDTDIISEDVILDTNINLSEMKEDLLITSGGTHVLTGNLEGQIVIDTTEDLTLVCDNITVKNESGPAIYVKNSGALTLELLDGSVNTLIDGSTYLDTDLKGTLYTTQDLLITGDGELNIEANYNHAIDSKSLVIDNGAININNSIKDGIHVSENFDMNNGSININSEDDGIQSEGTIDILNGVLNINSLGDGIKSEGIFNIENGTINISNVNEGIESKDKIIILNGNISITSIDDGINATNAIVINGGTIFVETSSNDAIDSNGILEINGGKIEALGANMPEGGLDCDGQAITINKGEVIAAGGTNSTVSSSSQYVLLIGKAIKGQTIKIMNKDSEIFSYVVKKDFENMILSLDSLLISEDYSLLVDDSEILNFTTSEDFIIEAGGYNQGINFRGEMKNKEDFLGNKDFFRDENMQPEVSRPYFDENNLPPDAKNPLDEDNFRKLEDFTQESLEEENIETLNPDLLANN